MTTPQISKQGFAKYTEKDYGSPENRLKFVLYLRESQRFTIEDLALRSMYGPETVKAWFSASPQRKRDCSPRAVALLLRNLGLSEQDYWTIVSAS